MCRIAGIINPSIPTASLKVMVKEMCRLLQHGGPDDEGVFVSEEHHLVLGNRRLSLIDLSNCGHQPMSYAGNRYEITFNGEIYNYRELKTELKNAGYTFKTESDTEVILAAFAAWGTASFSRLSGMFAFALWDNVERKFYLVRDSAGIKPLYYAITKEGLAFASEIRAFKPIPYLQEENKLWQVYLMAYGHLPEPITVLKQVQPLKKGTYLCYKIRSGSWKSESFKQYHFTEAINGREQAISLIKDSLYQSVKSHLIADAPIGVFLSGGLDSSIIAMLSSVEKQAKLNTLSLFFEDAEFSEKKYQDMLLEKMDCTPNQYLLREEEFHQKLPDIFRAMDQPSSDGINTWFISKYAKETGLKAVLSGIGGDELFGGYPSFQRMKIVGHLETLSNKLLRSGKYTGLKKFRRMGYLSLGGATGKYLFLRGQFIPYEIARYLDLPEEQVWKLLEEQPLCEDVSQLTPKNQASWMETNLYMQNQLLRDADVMSMAHGVEIRIPYLDKEFLELAHSIKSSVKYAGERPKQLLIDSFKNILPPSIWNRPKMGFRLPFEKWLANNPYAKNIISPGTREYQRFISGGMHWSQFLTLLLTKNFRADFTSGATGIKRETVWEKYSSSPKFPVTETIERSDTRTNKILFLTLRIFSSTGGIEKVSKVAGKALYDLGRESGDEVSICSMYDKQKDMDEKYFPAEAFTGFGINKLRFMTACVRNGVKNDIVILSHANLLLVGFFIKLFSPKTQLILIAHGIEVWEPFTGIRKRMLLRCDKILAVSQYTEEVLIQLNKVSREKLQVLNNCLDPFLEEPVEKEKDTALLAKYHISSADRVLMTLTRLAARERYKGYDMVIESLHKLKASFPGLKYLIVGKYDEREKERLDKMISAHRLESQVIFAGFVPDEALADHFNLADIYIMPSEKEGFGIVFIEAMYYNKPVIAGNRDGSVDALLNGQLGLLVNPVNEEEITSAITKMILDKEHYLPDQKLLMQNFSYPVYKNKWKGILEDLKASPQETYKVFSPALVGSKTL
ncbi:MAG TPA: asparagine synthase (glutamine-hydrolyzing) [Hanamia sp.]